MFGLNAERTSRTFSARVIPVQWLSPSTRRHCQFSRSVTASRLPSRRSSIGVPCCGRPLDDRVTSFEGGFGRKHP